MLIRQFIAAQREDTNQRNILSSLKMKTEEDEEKEDERMPKRATRVTKRMSLVSFFL